MKRFKQIYWRSTGRSPKVYGRLILLAKIDKDENSLNGLAKVIVVPKKPYVSKLDLHNHPNNSGAV